MPTPSVVFTGRRKELDALHAALQIGDAALTPVPHALQGMGGVGKSQTAAYYAHTRRRDYDCVLWVVGQTPEELDAQLAGLAPELVPPVAVQAEQEATLRAVHHWFSTHGDWLLIVDNAERLPELRPHLPRHPTGRILLTTREAMPADFGKAIAVEHLDEETGALLLLRRAGRLTTGEELSAANTMLQAEAKAMSALLGGLPLALDQAGAYMQERGLSPAQYAKLYETGRRKLLQHYENPDHTSVAVTFALAIEQVKRIPKYGNAAVQLAQLCAFLAPDAIPNEIFIQGKVKFSNWFSRLLYGEPEFMEVCVAACKYALLRRESDPPGLWMHRLAQEVVCDSLTKAKRKAAVERVVLAVSTAFPRPEFPIWPLCDRLLPHALLCAEYITDYDLRTAQASRLLNNTAWYMWYRALYGEAEPLFQEALAICRQLHGEEHQQVAVALNNLALLYRDTGRYAEASSYLEQALEIGRKTIGEDHPDYAMLLDNLGGVYYYQHRHEEAAALKEQALEITKRTQGAEHPQVATCLNNLANVYGGMGRSAEAVSLLEEALKIGCKTLGEDHPHYGTGILNLATNYVLWERPAEAEPLLLQALSIYEQALGKEHPHIAACHYWLGRVRHKEGKREEAADHFRRALEIEERILGPLHPETADTREWLAKVG